MALWRVPLGLLMLLLLSSSSAADDVYRWRDSKGVIHFTDSPPSDGIQASKLDRYRERLSVSGEVSPDALKPRLPPTEAVVSQPMRRVRRSDNRSADNLTPRLPRAAISPRRGDGLMRAPGLDDALRPSGLSGATNSSERRRPSRRSSFDVP